MITQSNIREVLADIPAKELRKAYEYDYVLIWVHTFNTGSVTTIDGYDWSDQKYSEANDNGQLFIDWDTLEQLYEDCNLDLELSI